MAEFAARHPGRPPARPLPRSAVRSVLALFAVAALIAIAALIGYTRLSADVRHQVQVGNHRWCATLHLLTAHPVPRPADPHANPSRENAYVFYVNLLQLRQQFGCS
jgi:hypothetical protein